MIEDRQLRLKKSIEYINDLTSFLPNPKSEREILVQKIYKINLLITDLKEKNVISKTEELELKIFLAPIEYNHILSSKDVVDNEERKRRIKISLLNDWMHLSGLGNLVRFIDC